MRTKTIKIDGKNRDCILLAGIPKLVKIYSVSGYDKPFLHIGKQFFTLQDELDTIVMRYVNLKYYNKEEQDKIIDDFKKLCSIYK